jgi:hypothetical protein
MMRVKVIAMDALVRIAGDPDARYPLVGLEYEDRRSTNVDEALDSVWRICTSAHHKLTDSESRLRDAWDAQGGGLGLSVGDLVEVDGVRYRRQPSGWTSA